MRNHDIINGNLLIVAKYILQVNPICLAIKSLVLLPIFELI